MGVVVWGTQREDKSVVVWGAQRADVGVVMWGMEAEYQWNSGPSPPALQPPNSPAPQPSFGSRVSVGETLS